jgi:hypothetical protein
VFKKLMWKRNMELNLEAIQELKENTPPVAETAAESEELEQQFKEVLQEKAAVIKDQEESKESEDVVDTKGKTAAQIDMELKAAIDANLYELEVMRKKEESEQAELEKAIRASIATENDRQQALMEDKAERANAALERHWDDQSKVPEPEVEETKANELVAEAKPASPAASRAKAAKKEPTSPAASADSKFEPADAKAHTSPEPTKRKIKPMKTASKGEMRPLSMVSSSEAQAQIEDQKQKALESYKRNMAQLDEQREQEEQMRKQAEVTKEEMAKRAKYLRAQRDKLLEKKKKDRAKKLAKHERRKREEAEEREQYAGSSPSSGRGGGAGFSSRAAPEAKAQSPTSGGSSEDKKRETMRLALARRLKEDLLMDDKEKRAHEQQAQVRAVSCAS